MATRLGRPLEVHRPADGSCLRCGAATVCVEPLVEILRAPAIPCATRLRRTRPRLPYEAVLDKSWLWLNDSLPPRVPAAAPARAFLFDLGASTYWADHRGVLAPSQSWLIEQYAAAGVQFDRVLAWEAKPHTAREIWASVPLSAKAVLSYYNVPVSADRASSDHPWAYVARLATPEDLVVVKLDIDDAPTEQALLEQLLHDHVNVSAPTPTPMPNPHQRGHQQAGGRASSLLPLCFVAAVGKVEVKLESATAERDRSTRRVRERGAGGGLVFRLRAAHGWLKSSGRRSGSSRNCLDPP